MPTIRISPLSLLLGGVIATGAFLLMGQASTYTNPPRVEYGPNPRDMLQIKEGTPYTVPPGRLFVLTALGVVDLPVWQQAFLRVNGVDEVGGAGGDSAFVGAVPPGFTVASGSTIEVRDVDPSDLNARAWGYLANQ